MNYTKKDLGSYGLHLIHTDKLKTITVRVMFMTPIIKEDITKRILLSDILLQSTNKYESKRAMTIEAEELYSADIAINNQRLGNYIVTSFNLKVLEDHYTEEGNLEKALAFLSEIIFNPDIENKSFKKEKLDIAKYNSVVSISSIKEDASGYSLTRMTEAYDKDSPISYRMTGYLEDLEKADEKNLYDTYTKMIDNDYVEIFTVGKYDNKEMISLIKKYFKFKKIKKPKASYVLPIKKCRKRRLIAKETIDNTQSKLAIACPLEKMTPYQRDYPLVLANLLLGGNTESRLFQEVREKNSLCYTIHSFASKLDQLLIITAGIDKNNFEKTVDLIKKNLSELQKGHFTEKEIEVAKSIYQTALEEIEESDNRMIAEVLSEDILGIDSIEGRMEKMNYVKKQDIVKVLKKIHIDTIFLLEGVKQDEED